MAFLASSLAALPSKVILKDLRRDLPAESAAVLHRMMEMQSGQDARPVHLLEPIRRAVEVMGVDAIAECGGVIHDDVNLAGSKEVFHKARRHTRRASMRRRIFRVIGSGRQRCPAPIRRESGIAAARADGGNGPPEVI